jgi:tryptophan-rich sensory protein
MELIIFELVWLVIALCCGVVLLREYRKMQKADKR